MVGILKIAADYECEEALGAFVLNMLHKGTIPCLGALQKRYQPSAAQSEMPEVNVTQHPLRSYNQLLSSFLTEEATYA
jgi:hypothetical protein